MEPINGELFLLEFGRGSPAGLRRRIVETRLRHFEAVALGPENVGPADLWMLNPLNRPRDHAELQAWMSAGKPLHVCDGPCKAEHLPIVGRVVGVLQAPASPPVPALRRLRGRIRIAASLPASWCWSARMPCAAL